MACNLGRLLSSSVTTLSRSEPLLLLASKSGIRLMCSSTQLQSQASPSKERAEAAIEESLQNQSKVEEDEVDDDADVNKETGEVGGPRGPEPTRYGDWERNGRCSDF